MLRVRGVDPVVLTAHNRVYGINSDHITYSIYKHVL